MGVSYKRAGLTAASLALVAAGLGGCLSNTYGTGVNPGQQTINDITGLVNLNAHKDPIDYRPRPPVVAPPASAALPSPGGGGVAATTDWPKDPDEAAKARKAAAAQVRHSNNAVADSLYDPDIEIPVKHDAEVNWKERSMTPAQAAMGTKEQDEEARKLIAEAKAGAGVDANGNPIRKTLSEPPVVYRAPDPNAPTEFKAVKKGFHWPWQKAKPDDTTTGLTDDSADASASGEKTTQ